MKSILGVVLCGGESKRMGSDKGLLPIRDTLWVEFITDKIQALNIPVVVSINPTQRDNYSRLFKPEQLITDKIAVEGPLRGLLSVHQHYPSKDLLLMACDMIDMEELTLRNILHVYESQPSYHFYVYQNENFIEPFGGIYTSTGLKYIMEKVISQTINKISLKGILKRGITKRISLESKVSFKNYNSL